ncbi:unnamed protein product [Paramecium sonneborni]|uniref:Uncharacterized protein n=1 Tax=Paramecium sonneborni TaxID=65129 RepID=A0A8S1MFP9_9CILI|nr:unnamed protein product [Paramecium sonneborni]
MYCLLNIYQFHKNKHFSKKNKYLNKFFQILQKNSIQINVTLNFQVPLYKYIVPFIEIKSDYLYDYVKYFKMRILQGIDNDQINNNQE